MIRGRDHYDPVVQDPPVEYELPAVRGMRIELPGVYVSADDVSVLAMRYAEQWHGEAREALIELARYFTLMTGGEADSGPQDAPEPPSVAAPETPEAQEPPAFVYSRPEPQAAAGAVARVEVFPEVDAAGLASYWRARGVNGGGVIVDHGIGSINHEDLIRDCGHRWPGIDIFELPDETSDSVWNETTSASTWNGRQRPSERRLFGQ